MNIKRFILGFSFIIIISCIISSWLDTTTHWDWSKIDTSKTTFNKDFLFGVSGAAYQYLGAENCPHSNWSYMRKNGIGHGHFSGLACDFWSELSSDIQIMKDMKLKAFRFSFEWSDIEPQKGEINQEAIKQYHELFDALEKDGIIPFMTLHHFTVPIWFELLGGFTHEENGHYFVDFCKLMVKEFGNKVTWWATFNEPAIYATNSYMIGEWPPGHKNIEQTGQVIKNMLALHVHLYKILKELQPNIKIGFSHNISPAYPYHPWNIIERIVCYYANQVTHEAITEFFATGTFKFHIPFIANITYQNSDAIDSFDYFGLNYYTNLLIRMNPSIEKMFSIECRIDETITYANSSCIYAQGLYEAIKNVSDRITHKRNIPIYITENGISDATDSYRATFIKQSLYALHKAVEDGYDVRGYFYWSLLDNFEWAAGYDMRFGLYDVDFNTQKRTLRKGAQPFLDIVSKTYSS